MEDSIKEILKGVNIIPKCGNPGTLIVFEHKLAYPILTGDDTSSVVFAAAEYGSGRIFVTSHESFIYNFTKHSKDFGVLWKNIKNWLLKNQSINDDDEIKSVEDFETVADIPDSVKILKWIGAHNKTELYIAQLLKKFVSNGGAIICGICPWGWLSLNQNRTIDEISLNKFITYCGICFGSEICSNELDYFDVSKNLALKSHFGDSINKLAKNINVATDNESILVNGIDSLPCHIASKYMEKLHRVIYPYILLHYKPSSKMSVSNPTGRALLSICSKIYQKFSSCGIKIRAPNIEEFPGCYSEINYPHLKTVIVTIKSKFDEFHCTGYYMAPGSMISVTVLEGSIFGWEVRISSHVDDLTSMPSLNRWPLVSSSMKLKKFMTITSAFGGIIYLDSPKGNTQIRLKLENVIETPFFDLNQPETILNWHKNSKASGLWAELAGKHIVFTCPTQYIQNLGDPSKVLQLWDLIVIANHELRGTDVKRTWRERIVVDIQPYNSIIHSGYPITIPYDYIRQDSQFYLFDENLVRKNGWGLIHELGHNVQRSCWTPIGTEEVTVNIFTLHVFHLVFRQKPSIQQIKDKINENSFKDYTDKNFQFEEWKKNPYIGLLIFVQLINSFGWNCFKILFREYESLSEKDKIFPNDSDKWDQLVLRLSNICGLDVSPLFQFWNIPYSKKPGTNLSDLTPWLPNDEITNQFPQRVDTLKSIYNDLLIGNEELYTSCSIVMYPEDFVFDSIEKLDSLKTFS